MKIGILESWWDGEVIAPGRTPVEVAEGLEIAGFDGVQIGGRWAGAERAGFVAALKGRPLRLLEWSREADLLASGAEERARAFEVYCAGLREAAELGAVQTVLIPSRRSAAEFHLKDFGVDRGEEATVIEELLVDALTRIAVVAEDLGALVVIEPLNRYESGIFHTVEDVARVCRAVGSPSVRLMADLFHMNIEETDPNAALRSVADVLGHVQLADSNRLEPGAGHVDFAAAFDALVEAGYDGWLSLECKFTADPSTDWVRAEWASARARQVPREGIVEQG